MNGSNTRTYKNDRYFIYVSESCLFFIIVGLNVMRVVYSSTGEEGKADCYKFLAMKASVITIIVVASTIAVKTILNF